MSKQKKSKGKGAPKQISEILIRDKAKNYVKAVKEYWRQQDRLESDFVKTADNFQSDIDSNHIFLVNAFKLIFLFVDGIVFLKFFTEGEHKPFVTHIINEPIDKWLTRGLLIPYKDAFVLFNKIKMQPGASVVINNALIDGVFIRYANVKAFRYNQSELSFNAAKAIIDFQISILGIIMQSGSAYFSPIKEQIISVEDTLDKLSQKVIKFKSLLEEQRDEEALHKFLKENPFLLKPASVTIPKQKLGEDFITDFVLRNVLDQGPYYTFVEIERSSHPILTKEGALSSQVNRAVKQTRDWDIWLEKNKSYIQNKLPGFESPEYLIIIGRSRDMNESEKAYLRSHNRGFMSIKILSYDDIIYQIEEFIQSAKE